MDTINLGILGDLDQDLVTTLVSSRRGLFVKSARSLGMLTSSPLVLALHHKRHLLGAFPNKLLTP